MQINADLAARLAGKKITLTGARGFIGARVLDGLLASRAPVRVLLRSGHGAAALRARGAEVIRVPLVAGPALQSALAGQDILIHTAYDMRAGMDENLTSFGALMAAAKGAGIRRVAHVSSAVVYDSWPGGRITEDDPVTDDSHASYRQAKITMENNLLQSDFEVAILQPTIVYGLGSALWTKAPMAALAGGGIVLPEPAGRCALVHVDDVVQGILLGAALGDLGQEKFLINGSQAIDWHEFYSGYCDLIGGGTLLREPVAALLGRLPPDDHGLPHGPSMAAQVSARLRLMLGSARFEQLLGLAARVRPASGPQYPDRHMLGLYMANPDISIERARARLGYDPLVDFQTGLAGIRRQMDGPAA